MAKLADLTPDPNNINAHSERGRFMTEASVRKFGARLPGVLDRNRKIIDGNERSEVYADVGLTDVQIIKADPSKPLFVQYDDLDLSDPANPARELQVALHRSAVTSFSEDVDALADALEQGLDVSAWYRQDELDAIIDALNQPMFEGDDDSAGEDSEPEPLPLARGDVPDAVWPTDNDWGVPVLDINMQADAVDLPVQEWGASGRKAKMNGTYHFYVDDYRFEALWLDPSPIVNSGCVNVVEPNYSTNVQMPRAVVLWFTYRKRWLARWWQSRGVRIFVDLDVNPLLTDLNLMGVPRGWKSYACYMRQSDHYDEELDHFLDVAKAHRGGDDVLLLVVGGNQTVQEMCKTRPQCVWVPSFDQRFFQKKLYRNVKTGDYKK